MLTSDVRHILLDETARAPRRFPPTLARPLGVRLPLCVLGRDAGRPSGLCHGVRHAVRAKAGRSARLPFHRRLVGAKAVGWPRGGPVGYNGGGAGALAIRPRWRRVTRAGAVLRDKGPANNWRLHGQCAMAQAPDPAPWLRDVAAISSASRATEDWVRVSARGNATRSQSLRCRRKMPSMVLGLPPIPPFQHRTDGIIACPPPVARRPSARCRVVVVVCQTGEDAEQQPKGWSMGGGLGGRLHPSFGAKGIRAVLNRAPSLRPRSAAHHCRCFVPAAGGQSRDAVGLLAPHSSPPALPGHGWFVVGAPRALGAPAVK